MRRIFLALLVGNVLFAGWQALEPAPPPPRARDGLVERIMLVDELSRPGAGLGASAARHKPSNAGSGDAENSAGLGGAETAAGLGGTETRTAVSPSCFSIGPFRGDTAAADAAEELRAHGHAPVARSAEEDVWLGYWVYVDDLGSAADANAVAARFREGGIDDAYVVSDSELGTLVSLGVFSEERRAQRQRALARELGHDPAVVGRTRRADVIWLDVAASSGGIDLEALQPADSAAAVRREPCPGPAAP